MKSMSDKKMDMNSPGVAGEFFPSEVKHRKLGKVGETKNQKYPDTEELTYKDSNDGVSVINKSQLKQGFRH